MTSSEEQITVVTLEADTGKWLTNGTTYSQKVYLAAEADPAEWTEIDESEIPEGWDAPPAEGE